MPYKIQKKSGLSKKTYRSLKSARRAVKVGEVIKRGV